MKRSYIYIYYIYIHFRSSHKNKHLFWLFFLLCHLSNPPGWRTDATGPNLSSSAGAALGAPDLGFQFCQRWRGDADGIVVELLLNHGVFFLKMCWEWGKGNIQEFVCNVYIYIYTSYIYILCIIYAIYTHVQTWYFDILYVTLVTLSYTGFWHPTSCWMVAWAITPLDKSFSINCRYSQDLQKSWESVGWDDMTWQFLHDAGLPLGANPSRWKHWVAQIQWSKTLPRSSHYRSISEDQIEVTKKWVTHCWTKCISAMTKSIN